MRTKCFQLMVFPVVILLLSAFAFAQTFKVIQLTNNDIDEGSYSLNDRGQVVWIARASSSELFFYDGNDTTKIVEQLYIANFDMNSLGQVVQDGIVDCCDHEIFLYDGGTITQLTDNTYGESFAKINDNGQAVWQGYDGNDYEIFLYNGTTTIQLTNNSYDDTRSEINDNGQVVWEGYDGNDTEIFLYDGATTTQLTNNSYDDNLSGYSFFSGPS